MPSFDYHQGLCLFFFLLRGWVKLEFLKLGGKENFKFESNPPTTYGVLKPSVAA